MTTRPHSLRNFDFLIHQSDNGRICVDIYAQGRIHLMFGGRPFHPWADIRAEVQMEYNHWFDDIKVSRQWREIVRSGIDA